MQGLAVGEDLDQLLTAHPRPVPNRAGVHVNEVGGRIEADATHLSAQADGAELGYRHAGDEEVHRLALHVLAVLGDALRALAQRAIRGWRAIAANDADMLVGPALLINRPDEIEELRIHLGRFVPPPVAQELIHLGKAGLVVFAVALVDDGGAFLGVGVVELEGPGLGLGGDARNGADGEGQHEGEGGAQINERRSRFCPPPHESPIRLVLPIQNLSPSNARARATPAAHSRSARLIPLYHDGKRLTHRMTPSRLTLPRLGSDRGI